MPKNIRPIVIAPPAPAPVREPTASELALAATARFEAARHKRSAQQLPVMTPGGLYPSAASITDHPLREETAVRIS